MSTPAYQPDTTDLAILRLLQEDAFLTHKEIAGRLGLTTTPVYERIRRLEREGIIQGYVALVNREKVGKPLVVMCAVSLKEHAQVRLQQFESSVCALPEVTEVLHIAGGFDYLLKVVVRDMAEYQHFIVNKLAGLDNVGHAQSSFVLTELKQSTAVPL
ncbi:MAG TPA: Lrp/AsnC family transcriptional regulator [Saprospiraceae bacterium]|nr:Lrp/AsnC family transcriptional regulator [Saprospiraceae bacterium]HNM25469.1 Lrp/AsnC family transcriptional regulator [Saprospiraceae bacterium]